ncbi:hypothetical protein [Rhodopirellula baltica]|uniref:hypothetical protein n=1 Tax=Rhodopirellula baltica TaxID=265606 RepID=UPI0036F3EC52
MNPQIHEQRFASLMSFFNELDGVHGIFVDRHLRADAVERIVGIVLRRRRIGNQVVGEVSIDMIASRKMPRHHRSSTGRVDSTRNGEAIEISFLASKPIDVRHLDVDVFTATQVGHPQSSAKIKTMLGRVFAACTT